FTFWTGIPEIYRKNAGIAWHIFPSARFTEEFPKADTMTLFTRRHTLSFAVALAASAVLPAFAQTDPAAAQAQGFYDALVAQMKKGGPAKARYDMLKPAVE